MAHTAECVTMHEKAQAERAAWIAQWPKYCVFCDGFGEVGDIGGHDDSGGNNADPCECTINGRCPRCGQNGLTCEDSGDETTGDGPCTYCGWNYGDHAPLDDWDCDCDMGRGTDLFDYPF